MAQIIDIAYIKKPLTRFVAENFADLQITLIDRQEQKKFWISCVNRKERIAMMGWTDQEWTNFLAAYDTSVPN